MTLKKLMMLGLTLLAFLLRAYRLDFQSYWIDEGWTLYFARLPINELWHLLQVEEPKPPFYYFTILYWIRWLGDSEYALRFYSLIFGVMTAPLTYRLGRAMGDNRLGLLGALLMTIAPYQIWHAQDARMYTIFTAASVMSMWGFIKLWQAGGWRWWLLYVPGTEWVIATHYHGLVLIGIQGLFLLLTWRRHWRGYLAWAGTLIVIFLIYAPWLLFGSALLQSFFHWIEQVPLGETYIRGLLAYTVGEYMPRAEAIPFVLVFVLLYGIGLIYAARRRWGAWRGSEMLALLLAYTLAPNLAAWLYGEWRTPVYLERYLIPVHVGYLLTVAMGILGVLDFGFWTYSRPDAFYEDRTTHENSAGRRSPVTSRSFHPRWPAYLAATVLLLLLIGINGWVLSHHYFDPAYAKDDWRAVVRMIENFGQPGDAIIMTGDGGEKVFNYYYRGNLPIYLDFHTPVPPQEQARQIMTEIAARHRRIWYTPYGVEIDATLESWLAEHAYPAWHSWLGRKRLALYDSNTAGLNRLENVNTTFADSPEEGLALVKVALPSETIAAGDLLPLALTWLTTPPLAHDYQLSLRLSNQQGDIFGQSDWPPLSATSTWPPGQPIIDRRSFWLPPDTPPGDYVLQLVIYDPASGQPLGQPALISPIAVGPAQITPPLEALAIPNPTRQALGDLRLVGYALPGQIQPGQELWLWLYWQAGPSNGASSREGNPTIRLNLSDGTETVVADFPLAGSVGPLVSWQPGQVRRAVYHMPTHPRLTGALAQLRVARLTGAGQVEAEISLASLALVTRPRDFEIPAIAHPLEMTFGLSPQLRLIGYDLAPTGFAPGDTLPLTLYWQAETEVETNYTVFVQLLNSANQVVAQVDQQPLAGAAPTTTWLPGEILTDPYPLSLPADLPPGDYRLITGLYAAATGERLPVSTGGDFVELPPIAVGQHVISTEGRNP